MTNMVYIQGEYWEINLEKQTLKKMSTGQIRKLDQDALDHFRSIVRRTS